MASGTRSTQKITTFIPFVIFLKSMSFIALFTVPDSIGSAICCSTVEPWASNKLPWIYVSFLCLYLCMFHWIITCRPLHLCLEWKYQNFAYGLLVWETWIVLFEMISTAWKISSFFAFWFVYKFRLGCPCKNKSYARQESLTLYQSVQLCHQVLLGPSSHFLAPSWNASSL